MDIYHGKVLLKAIILDAIMPIYYHEKKTNRRPN